MTDDERAEAMKDLAHQLELRELRGRRVTGTDAWTTIVVRHAGFFEDTADGWVVEIEEGSL